MGVGIMFSTDMKTNVIKVKGPGDGLICWFWVEI